ncbi:McrC family protein [Picrophilus oshimae]|nr:hypothetical protein [Picrophilus oshimae]
MTSQYRYVRVIEYNKIRDEKLVEDLKELYLKDDRLSKFIKIDRSGIYFKHYVGTIQTSRYRVSILPKIWGEHLSDNDIIRNLFRLLIYTYQNPSLLKSETVLSIKSEKSDILEILIRLYANSLEDQLRKGLYKQYVRKDEETMYLKGRLNIKKQITHIDQSFFDVINYRFSADNGMNRYFAYATSLFSAFTNNYATIDLLNSIDVLLRSEGISNRMPFNTVSFNRLNERFEIPYNYAEMIMKNMRLDIGNDKRTMMMLFDMNMIFQNFFTIFIIRNRRKIFQGKTVRIIPQYSRRNFIFSDSHALRITKPDLYIEVEDINKKNIFILDMKYKLLQKADIEEYINDHIEDVYSVSQLDLYQMFTYSDLYGTDGTILVFPGRVGAISNPYMFKENGRILWICIIPLDFTGDSWEERLVECVKGFFDKIIKNVLF